MTFRQKITNRRFRPRAKLLGLAGGALVAAAAGFAVLGGEEASNQEASNHETSNQKALKQAQKPGALLPAGAAAEAGGLPVRAVLPEPAEFFTVQRPYTGTLTARRRVDAAFQTRARITAVLVDEGDRFTRGQVLAKLDTRRLQAEVDRLAADVDAAQARLDELTAGPRKEIIQQAQAARDRAGAEVELTQLRLERMRTIHGNRSATDDELDAARLDHAARAAALAEAQARLAELENGTRPETLAAQRAAVARLSAALTRARIELDDAVITAPFDGSVDARLADAGDLAAPGSPVLRLLDVQNLQARIGLPPDVAGSLTVGQTVSLQTGRDPLTATLRAIAPSVDRLTNTRTAIFDTPAAPDAPDASVAVGETVRLSMAINHPMAGAWLPKDSLTHSRRGLWSVMVVEQGRAKRVDVEVLHHTDGRVFVRGPLQSDQPVISGNLNKIVPGQLVRVLETPSAEAIAVKP